MIPTELITRLVDLGFTQDAVSKQTQQANAEAQGMNESGAYVVQTVLVKGDVVVSVEQNQGVEQIGGLHAQLNYPSVAVVASPKGRVAFNPEDIELAVSLVEGLS